mgnify:CR=1 FL=1
MIGASSAANSVCAQWQSGGKSKTIAAYPPDYADLSMMQAATKSGSSSRRKAVMFDEGPGEGSVIAQLLSVGLNLAADTVVTSR